MSKSKVIPSQFSGFDRVAGIYDFLAKLVFGNRLNQAKTSFFSQIHPGNQVLIIGGGSGWILPMVLDRIGEKGTIVFVEASGKMLQKAQRRIRQHPLFRNVHFLHGTQYSIPSGQIFDQIHTHFFLDLFEEEELITTVDMLDSLLSPSGIWLLTDFSSPNNVWNLPASGLIRLMYWFFRVSCGIQAKHLPDYQSVLKQAGYEKMKEKVIWNGMIKSFLYQKVGSQSEL